MRLSIGMMVKNEAKNLERCLESLQPLLNDLDSELIIVDTGSEDNTVEIARKYTDKVYFHAWNNDFAAMRNITISYAQGEWFLVIDADEVLGDPQEIIKFLKTDESQEYNVAFLFVKSYMQSNNTTNFSSLLSNRLFRRNEKFHYTGAVHNQAVFDGAAHYLPGIIHHYGYISDDQELMERKFIRTSAILKRELEKDPEHIYYLYQLSVAYGSHKDFKEAIDYSEKAYQVFIKLGKPMRCMFVMTHRAMIYQMAGDYIKVEEACQDALELSTDYIDVYFYLAEAQAMLGKYPEAIPNFLKYLEMLAGYYEVQEKDGGITEYTLGNAEYAYFNLTNMFRKVGDLARALTYAEKITSKQLVETNLPNIIYLFIALGQYSVLKQYHEHIVEPEGRNNFYQQLEEIKQQFNEKVQLAIAEAFCETDDAYGLLSAIIVEGQHSSFSEPILARIREIDVAKLPMYCSSILYYLMRYKFPLHTILTNFKENNLSCLFEKLVKQHNDLTEKIYEYLTHYQGGSSLSEYKLGKTLCRYGLLMNQLENEEYNEVFARYLQEGTAYLHAIYNTYIIDNLLVYEVKNDEEVFLLYMYYAQINKQKDKDQYAKYLNKALQAFPAMKKGTEMLLKEIQSEITPADAEFNSYKIQIKKTIKQLIETGNMDEAKIILGEYKSIVPNDMEAILLESKIMLN